MRKKLFFSLFMSTLFILLLTGCGKTGEQKNDTVENSTYKMVITNEVATTHWKTTQMEKLKDLLEQKSNGRIKVELYPAGQLYKDKEAVQALGTGAVQMVWPVSVNLEQIKQDYGIISLPFSLNDKLMLENAQFRGDLLNLLSKQVEQNNIVVLGLLRADEMIFIFKDKKPKTPTDIQNVKVRAIGGQVTLDWLKELKISAVSMPATEMTTALSQGVIDGIHTSSDGWEKMIGELGQYGLIVPGLQIATYSVVVDKAWFEALPDDLQKVVRDVVNEIAEAQWQDSIDMAKKAFNVIREDFKADVYLVPESELNQWATKVEPAITRFSKQFPQAYTEFKELNNKYNHEWPLQ